MTNDWLRAPVTDLRGVGPRLAGHLDRLRLHNLGDLLFHLPLRYEDRSRIVPIAALLPGMRVVVRGQVVACDRRPGRRTTLLVLIEQEGARLGLRFFHRPAAAIMRLEVGRYLQCFGEVRAGPSGLEIAHPEVECFDPQALPVLDSGLTPIYPTVAGLGQNVLRRLVAQVLDRLDGPDGATIDILPRDLPLPERIEPSLVEALRRLHHPPASEFSDREIMPEHPSRRRLVIEELIAHQLGQRQARQRLARRRAPRLESGPEAWRSFCADLPFTLTPAQQRAIEEIVVDIGRPRPMQRLLQGDVGCGKTVVAAAAIVETVAAGYQAALMAPTELLAEQHRNNLAQWLEPRGIVVEGLSGRLPAAERRHAEQRLREGHSAVAVGTHALFQAGLAFARLGLVIIDEQHRFGVGQRLALLEKGRHGDLAPHCLLMTATPIPRTLLMTAYAALDCSLIDELPPGRRAVETVVVSDRRRTEVIERVRHAVQGQRQVYWVCTLIEESEELECQAAESVAAELAAALPGCRVGLVHGRLDGRDKAAAMDCFRQGEIDVLVATTVIEVGVDVPNASVMIIENAERLGLSQLHQLRGRIGRGDRGGTCVLLYRPPLSALGRERLAVMRNSSDGFEIAQRDMELRGPGELLGTRQAGHARFRLADLCIDQGLIPWAAEAAEWIETRRPELVPSLLARWLGESALRCSEV